MYRYAKKYCEHFIYEIYIKKPLFIHLLRNNEKLLSIRWIGKQNVYIQKGRAEKRSIYIAQITIIINFLFHFVCVYMAVYDIFDIQSIGFFDAFSERHSLNI